MSTKTCKVFSPAGISSFFEICDETSDGKPITDPERIGARGGGFVIERGVLTEATLEEAARNEVKVSINGKPSPEAETTKTVAQMLLQRVSEKYKVMIKHRVDIPIGAGFGSSAGGALGASLALSKVLGLKLTYNEIGGIAHIAEVRCKTGLGTVGPLMLGGCILTLEPGGPGKAIIDRIPVSADHAIVAGTFGPLSTKDILSRHERRIVINKWGRKTLKAILDEPSLENFMVCCQDFGRRTGFTTERTKALMKLAENTGAIGVAQNMVGEAVHALTKLDNTPRLVRAFRQVLPKGSVISAKIDLRGIRLVA